LGQIIPKKLERGLPPKGEIKKEFFRKNFYGTTKNRMVENLKG